MRVIVLGGTRFIGRAIVEELVAGSHEVMVVHRGGTEPADLPKVAHLHADRRTLPDRSSELAAFEPEVFIDTVAMTSSAAETALEAIPEGTRPIVLSSADVYRAYEGLMSGVAVDVVPVTEDSPVREHRYPLRGQLEGMDDYEKLDVEDAYAARDGVILRLPFVYGEHDYQGREEFVLSRVRAKRSQLPFGIGNFLGTRGYVRDIARGVRLAAESPSTAGETFNLTDQFTLTMRQLAAAIIEESGSELELVQVADDVLPPDLQISGAVQQHFLIDSSKARRVLGWQCAPWRESLKTTVDWHLANPPPSGGAVDFKLDDAALGT